MYNFNTSHGYIDKQFNTTITITFCIYSHLCMVQYPFVNYCEKFKYKRKLNIFALSDSLIYNWYLKPALSFHLLKFFNYLRLHKSGVKQKKRLKRNNEQVT